MAVQNHLFSAFLLVWASIIMFVISLFNVWLMPEADGGLNLRIFILPCAVLAVIMTLTTARKDLYQNETRRWYFCLIAGLIMMVLPFLTLFVL